MAKCLDLVKKGKVIDGVFTTPVLYRKHENVTWQWQGKVAAGTSVDKYVDITPYLPNDNNPFGAKTELHGFAWSVSGLKNTRESAVKISTVGKNTGKKNEVSPVVVALNEIDTQYNKKVREGYSPELVSDLPTDFEQLYKMVDEHGKHRVYMEKLHDYKKFKHKLSFPVLVQRKLNGTTMGLVYHPVIANTLHVDCFLRGRTTFHQGQMIAAEAVNILGLAKYPGLYLMGELYLHGENLEDISGSARLIDAANDADSGLEYYVFDCFRLDHPDEPFTSRYSLLQRLFDASGGNLRFCKLLQNFTANSEEEVLAYEKQFLSEGYEGAIIRAPDGINHSNLYKTVRSYETLKLKPFYDAEYKIVGYTQGRGKDAGRIIFICETSTGYKFNVRPKMTDDERKNLYESMTKLFDTEYKNKLAKIQYAYLSKNGVPQQPVMLGLRSPATL